MLVFCGVLSVPGVLSFSSPDDDDSQWFDAAWEIAVTVIGGLVTAFVTCLLGKCWISRRDENI